MDHGVLFEAVARRRRWRLPADRRGELKFVDSIGHEPARRIPPERNAEFVRAMENALEGHVRSNVAGGSMDETGKPLVKETRVSRAARPGRPERFDDEYERNGTVDGFMFRDPPASRRRVAVTDRRTPCDGTEQVRARMDMHYPRAERVTVGMDNARASRDGRLRHWLGERLVRRNLRARHWTYSSDNDDLNT